MRLNYRTIVATVVAVLALGAVAASDASAHEFHVAGSPLTETVAATGSGGTANMVWHILKAEVHIECKSTALTDRLKTGGKSAGEITFTSCKMPENKSCSVPNVNYHFEGNLALSGSALVDEFLPEKGVSTLFNLLIENAGEKSCSIKGTYPVDGKYTCALPGIETEAVEHEVACKPENSALTINNEEFTIGYTDKLALSTGQKWSAS